MAIAQPPQTEILTYEQYVQEFMNERPTLQPYEIIDGVRIPMTSPLLIHQRIIIKLILLLSAYELANRTGIVVAAPLDIVIEREPRLRVRQPDVLFLTNECLQRAGGVMMEGPLEIAPELVIEVLSPSETRRTVQDKVEDFRRVGVMECWLVSSQGETIQVLRLSEQGIETAAVYANGQTLQSLVFPDLTLPLADVFAV